MVKKEYEKDHWTLDVKQALQFDQPKDSGIRSITLKVREPEDIGQQKDWLIHLLGGGMVSLATYYSFSSGVYFCNAISLMDKRYQRR